LMAQNPVIQRGDVLHCDFGIVGMGLHTDTQHMGYVLGEGEEDVPDGLKEVLTRANRLQDIVIGNMKPGLSGNSILRSSLEQMKDGGIQGSVYSHPIGRHGHGAGPLVGLWDRQEGVPGRGDVPVIANTWYSIELQASHPVPEWGGKVVRCALEEDVAIDSAGNVSWVLRRQTAYHIVK
jgi:Xaa-Pro aminopeptidase